MLSVLGGVRVARELYKFMHAPLRSVLLKLL